MTQISGIWDEHLLARLVSELDQIHDIDLTLTGCADEEVYDGRGARAQLGEGFPPAPAALRMRSSCL